MDNKSHRQKILENLDYIKNLFAVEGESLSETQIQRYLSGETKTGYNIRLVY